MDLTEGRQKIVECIKQLCSEYPSWGSCRITNWLRKRENLLINRKTVQRIMRKENLIVQPRENGQVGRVIIVNQYL